MAKKKCPECPKCMASWIATFGDMMSLLLTFFILLLSMSTMDAKKVQDAIGSLAGALSVLEGGTKTEISRERQQQATPIDQREETTQRVKTVTKTIADVNEIVKATGKPEVSLKESEDGFIVRLPSALLFKEGSAAIDNDDAILFLKRIAMIARMLPDDVVIEVIGHTDDVTPSSDSLYRDNWDLSAARATSVVKELIAKSDVNPAKLIASGRASSVPISSNATSEGRAENRRVEIHFSSKSNKNTEEVKRTVLDEAN